MILINKNIKSLPKKLAKIFDLNLLLTHFMHLQQKLKGE